MAAFEEHRTGVAEPVAAATALASVWTPPKTNLVLPTVFPDDIEVQVFATTTGATLVGAIELVSPANKDRRETRQAFTRGIGLIVADLVTNPLFNLHNEIVASMGHGQPFLLDPTVAIYAVAYRPSRQTAGDQIEIWPEPLKLGAALPTLPLGLRSAGVVPVDLDETYHEACRHSRLE